MALALLDPDRVITMDDVPARWLHLTPDCAAARRAQDHHVRWHCPFAGADRRRHCGSSCGACAGAVGRACVARGCRRHLWVAGRVRPKRQLARGLWQMGLPELPQAMQRLTQRARHGAIFRARVFRGCAASFPGVRRVRQRPLRYGLAVCQRRPTGFGDPWRWARPVRLLRGRNHPRPARGFAAT